VAGLYPYPRWGAYSAASGPLARLKGEGDRGVGKGIRGRRRTNREEGGRGRGRRKGRTVPRTLLQYLKCDDTHAFENVFYCFYKTRLQRFLK